MPVNFFFLAAIVLVIIISLIAFSTNNYLKTEEANPAEVQGKFTLLLYGSGASNEFANIAILDKEGDPYSFEIFAPGFSYTVQAGLDAVEALQAAELFVRRNIQTERSRLQRVLNSAGTRVGFELRPLYPVAIFGKNDVLDVRYQIKGRKIVVRIVLDSAVEKQTMN